MIEITEKLLEGAKTPNGGYSGAQVRFAQKLTGESQWKGAMVGLKLLPDAWDRFVSLRCKLKKDAKKRTRRQEQAEHLIYSLLRSMELAIEYGDWQVDGINDPELYMLEAAKFLKSRGYKPEHFVLDLL